VLHVWQHRVAHRLFLLARPASARLQAARVHRAIAVVRHNRRGPVWERARGVDQRPIRGDPRPVQTVNSDPWRGEVSNQALRVPAHLPGVREAEVPEQRAVVAHRVVPVLGDQQHFLRPPESVARQQERGAGYRALLGSHGDRRDDRYSKVVACRPDDLDGPRPDARERDEGVHVLVLPGAGLVVQEVEQHGVAHAVRHEDTPRLVVQGVRVLDQPTQVLVVPAKLVW
ncbi:hypothetical protein EGW08_002514, partial [Elysia chlorotica]